MSVHRFRFLLAVFAVLLSGKSFAGLIVDFSAAGMISFADPTGVPVIGPPGTPYSIDVSFTLPESFGNIVNSQTAAGQAITGSDLLPITPGSAPGGFVVENDLLTVEFQLPALPGFDRSGLSLLFESKLPSPAATPFSVDYFENASLIFVAFIGGRTFPGGEEFIYDISNDAVVTTLRVRAASVPIPAPLFTVALGLLLIGFRQYVSEKKRY